MLSRRNPQLNKHGELIHLLSVEGLPRDIVTHILDTASSFASVSDREVKKVPLLRGKSVFNLFFENSTRTSAQPSVVSAWMSERATRECNTSPTMATVRFENSFL